MLVNPRMWTVVLLSRSLAPLSLNVDPHMIDNVGQACVDVEYRMTASLCPRFSSCMEIPRNVRGRLQDHI